MTDAELIVAAVNASGLSARRFAEWVLARDETTVRRWSSGRMVIPAVARRWLERFVALPDRRRARLIGELVPDDASA